MVSFFEKSTMNAHLIVRQRALAGRILAQRVGFVKTNLTNARFVLCGLSLVIK
jgi:hypothetical protein